MSIKQYPGGIVTKNPTAPTTSSASGIWTLDQASAYIKEGIWPVPTFNYIEDVFSTWLYTGSSPSSQSINNGINLSANGGMVWLKDRSITNFHSLFDTTRGAGYYLSSSQTSAQTLGSTTLTSFNSNGFSLGGSTLTNDANPYVSWTFQEKAKFFDVVTYTGNGSSTQVINHSLGSRPGAVFFKKTSATSNWVTYNRVDDTTTCAMFLNKTDASLGISNSWMTSTTITAYQLGADTGLAADNMNDNGATYVAYIFAHNAGGFGLTGTDNVITCGSYTTDGGGNATVNLGWEPQWLLTKSSSSNDTVGWSVYDNMRGLDTSVAGLRLIPNSAVAETGGGFQAGINATGFSVVAPATSTTYIYIAIRRGPMAVPTTGTSVFVPKVLPANSASATTPVNAGLTTDMVFGSHNSDNSGGKYFASRLLAEYRTDSTSTAAEAQGAYYWDNMVGVRQQETNAQPAWYFLKRAPGFFDEVCYTGTGSAGQTYSHNLGVVPELMIVKDRSQAGAWLVYSATIGNTLALRVDTTGGTIGPNSVYWNNTTPTSSVFSVGTSGAVNTAGDTYVAYLFATCAGVSKVGSYTGTGTLTTINCGFTGGARFVLIKRTDSSGAWYVWDTARGMVSGTDPSLALNSTAAQSNANSVYTIATGFQLLASPSADVNTNGGTYIYLAIA